MKIEHLAIWTNQLEKLKDFYCKFFEAVANERYHNVKRNFSSYFLSFESGARLEIMQMQGISATKDDLLSQRTGLIHFAISVGSEEKVNSLTQDISGNGFTVIDQPRRTGDGYYESVVMDPDNNRVEITI